MKVEPTKFQFYCVANNANERSHRSHRHWQTVCNENTRLLLSFAGENESEECHFIYCFEVWIYVGAEVGGEAQIKEGVEWMERPWIWRGATRGTEARIFARHADISKTLHRDKWMTHVIQIEIQRTVNRRP